MSTTCTDELPVEVGGDGVALDLDNRLARDFSLLGVISLAWNCVNVFGGLSFIFVVGFSAGGLPAIFYGFIGASVCVACMTAVLAECASIFPTAGGAYHFATFLVPQKYRSGVGFVLGWINYLAWTLAAAACYSILSSLIFAFVFETHPDFSLSGRYQLFLVYVAVAIVSWAANLFCLSAIPLLGNIGCYGSMATFVAFTITLLAVSKKADPASVFVDVINATGYSSNAMAVVLGLYNSMTALVALDASCHMAEEIKQPTRMIPKILYITIALQFLVGVVWILAIGFSIQDSDAIINSPSGVPIFELILQGTRSKVAQYIFMVMLTINYIAAAVGCSLTASRQGYALARDGGLFLKTR
ncbi:hypothetical protein A1O3_09340 [Capronia epimyces CBS 606.96]|uniref:Uncharacterized protein n=1 Tax=Capronia epimyces CBS 606.96 TaxID=1182542 RepID=W9Y6Y3_9EURO|nr:uncharacterized protein A1O3_09340 [Capronia epimyces CBS 606.96]EXJ78179.1 hypothetical protein A1O3_09340 [Capronia epimyces CBS 606.96]